ncbi:MAG: sensor histidine kinase N-terminal domain-containing protein [Burkholderiales bacterium]|nr:sensor histidine kinase N-terminal domain-containing protein [Burkholderiales bacterium]
MHSLRRRLLAWVLPTCIVAAALASAATYWGAAKELAGLLDGQLEYLASHVTVDGGRVGIDRSNVYAERLRDDRMDAVVLQVWYAGKLEYTDESIDLPEPARTGFADVVVGGQKWHTFALRRGDRIIQVGQAQDERWEALMRVALQLLWPLFACVAAAGVALWFGIGKALRPVRVLAAELADRDADRLRPVSVASVPSEVEPLFTALNDMLRRLDHAFAAQRRFVADAAHELRTPVMALAMQAELADTATSEQERRDAVRELRAGAQRLTRLTQQLLNLAQLDPASAPALRQDLDLAELAREVVLDQADAAERKGIDLGLDAPQAVTVQGVRDHLAMLLRNLVDNAIRYTPPGGRVDVCVQRDGDGRAIVEVRDDGPGIPEDERATVFERFRRGAGIGGVGSGLGLAIASQIAQEHGAAIEIGAGLGGRGTGMRVTLAAAPRPGPKRLSEG